VLVTSEGPLTSIPANTSPSMTLMLVTRVARLGFPSFTSPLASAKGRCASDFRRADQSSLPATLRSSYSISSVGLVGSEHHPCLLAEVVDLRTTQIAYGNLLSLTFSRGVANAP
jgi:hypothetical protein